MLPDRVSNPGPLTYESGALPIALRGPALRSKPLDIGYIVEKLHEYLCLGKLSHDDIQFFLCHLTIFSI